MSNVILGLCANYSIDQLAPFVTSLRATDFNGEVTFFVDRLSGDTKRFLHAHDCRTIPFHSIRHFRGAQTTRRLVARAIRTFCPASPSTKVRSFVTRLWHCAASRYFLYATYLENTNGRFEKVLLTDVRDVVFQRDPFDFLMRGAMCAFQESLARIGDDYFNSQWIIDGFGKKVFQKLSHRPVYCSGVTIGTTSGVLGYLAAMTKELTIRVGFMGYDQGIHNYLVHTDAIPDLAHYTNWTGPVLTLGTVPEQELAMPADGLLRNHDGAIVNVIHQYDRQPTIAPRVLGRISRASLAPSPVYS
jgi:hypothetical protein